VVFNATFDRELEELRTLMSQVQQEKERKKENEP